MIDLVSSPRNAVGGKRAAGETSQQVLRVLRERGALRQKELAAALGMTAGAVSYHMPLLLSLGRVERVMVRGCAGWQLVTEGDASALACRPSAMANKVRVLEQLQTLLKPEISAVLAEVVADYKRGLLQCH